MPKLNDDNFIPSKIIQLLQTQIYLYYPMETHVKYSIQIVLSN